MPRHDLAIWMVLKREIDLSQNVREQYKRRFEQFNRAGITLCFPFVVLEGEARLQNPHLKSVSDDLSVMLELSKPFGLEMHPLFGFGCTVTAHPERTYQARPREGEDWNFPAGKAACASWTENQDRLVAVIEDVVQRYPVSGIHLDYFRYTNMAIARRHPCECKACGDRREPWLGHRNLTLTDLAVEGIVAKEVAQKTACIRATLERISAVVRGAGRMLSLAARARYLDDAVYEGQDWAQFARDGLFDLVSPMSYNNCPDRFARFVREHAHLLGPTPARYFAGVGKKSSMSDLSTESFIQQIEHAMENGADGVTIFANWGMTEADFDALAALRVAV